MAMRLQLCLKSLLQKQQNSLNLPVSIISRGKTTIKIPMKEYTLVGVRASDKARGKIYDKKPFKVTCVKGKSYLWCACGWSHTQPFCDGTHKNSLFKITMKPVQFYALETGDYWLCNCKQTSQRPFCDGTHRLQSIQDAVRI